MKINTILKTVLGTSLLILPTLSKKSECDELQKYLVDNVKDYLEISEDIDQEVIQSCTENDKGQIVDMHIENYILNQEQTNKILSLNSALTKLYYEVDAKKYIKYKEFPMALTKIPKLEKLTLNYDGRDVIPIKKGVLKVSKTLKSLKLSNVELSNDNFNDISTLENLRGLEINEGKYGKNVSSDSLSKLKNLSTLNFGYTLPKISTSIPSVKKLVFNSIPLTQENINALGKFPNVEELSLSMYGESAKNVDFKILKNLSKLKKLEITSDDVCKNLTQLPKSLVKINLTYCTVKDNLLEEISNLSNLEELVTDHTSFNRNKLDSLKKLTKLTTFEMK